MFNKTILFSGYRCDPYDVSEAWVAFKWLIILLKQFNVILLTTEKAKNSIYTYYNNRLPDNLQIIAFKDSYPFKNQRLFRDSIKLGYFFFNFKITSYLQKNYDIVEKCDLIFQKSPSSYRYFTTLFRLDKPLYLGPLSGGIRPPVKLKKYFRNESTVYKLRSFDRLILNLPVYRKQFAKVEKVIISFDYFHNILPENYLIKKEILLDVGIDSEQFYQSLNYNSKVQLLYVGRLTRYKGAELLIKSINKLKHLDFVLNIIGDGEERKKLEKMVKNYDLNKLVRFHGYKHINEVKNFYKNASIFCMPTLTESIGIVFFEAMASGLPIITIDNGGPKHICPNEGAIKVSVSSESEIINDLKDAISFLIKNPEKRREMGEFNRKYCIENYDWKVLEKNILSFFQKEILQHSAIKN